MLDFAQLPRQPRPGPQAATPRRRTHVPARRFAFQRSALQRFGCAVLIACAAGVLASACGGPSRPIGLTLSPRGAGPSYVYFGSIFGTTTYLMEARSGDIVHTWESDLAPAGSVYLMNNGHLMRGAREPDADPFRGGGLGGRLQEFTWDGQLVWDFVYATEDHNLHHDIELLPNGNILAIAWEAKTREETRAMGYWPEITPEGGIWPDKVIELWPKRIYPMPTSSKARNRLAILGKFSKKSLACSMVMSSTSAMFLPR